jgi:CheY-like chemotaxis protein
VLVGCRRCAGKIRISVCDTGLGIAKSKRRAIFLEFHRLAQGASVARGLGLGLSIVERIARVLDHPIDLISTVGKGSQFFVDVPSGPTLAATSPQPLALQHDNQGALSGMWVLCIDNEPKILDGMETLLAGWGCHVIKAPSIAAATAQLRIGPMPVGMLVDYHLDSENGIEAIRAVRDLYGPMPAILITADRSPEVRREARAADVAVLHKPVKPAALRALLGQWRAQRIAAAE